MLPIEGVRNMCTNISMCTKIGLDIFVRTLWTLSETVRFRTVRPLRLVLNNRWLTQITKLRHVGCSA